MAREIPGPPVSRARSCAASSDQIALPDTGSPRSRRPPRAARQRLAHLAILLNLLLTLAAAVCISFGDRLPGLICAGSSLSLGTAAALLVMCRRPFSRLLGYSLGAAIIALLIGAAGVLLPSEWTELRPASTTSVAPADGANDIPPGPPPEFPQPSAAPSPTRTP